jgi:hypothetical protein
LTNRRKISRGRLEVYRLAIEDNCQKSICQQLGKSKGTVSGHIKGLLSDSYLIEVSGKDQTKFYEKGPKSKILDEILVRCSSENQRGGRSEGTLNSKLRTVTPNSELPLPPSCDVHSHGVRARVNKIGDMDFLEKAEDGLRGVEQWFGSVELNGHKYSVKYQESENAGSWLYVWVQGTFTRSELEENLTEERLMASAQGVFNQISKHSGWQFGIMEAHKGSKTHYVPNSELVDELVKELPPNVLITAGELHTDNTPPREDGLPTLETKSAEEALGLLTPISDIKDMKVAIKIMVQNQEILINVVNTSLVNQQLLFKILEGLGVAPKPEQPKDEEASGVMFG